MISPPGTWELLGKLVFLLFLPAFPRWRFRSCFWHWLRHLLHDTRWELFILPHLRKEFVRKHKRVTDDGQRILGTEPDENSLWRVPEDYHPVVEWGKCFTGKLRWCLCSCVCECEVPFQFVLLYATFSIHSLPLNIAYIWCLCERGGCAKGEGV